MELEMELELNLWVAVRDGAIALSGAGARDKTCAGAGAKYRAIVVARAPESG